MKDHYFFEIPIYRCHIKKRTDEFDKERKRFTNFLLMHGGDQLPNCTLQKSIQRHGERQWYPWLYNEIIGYIRLYALGTQIRGETWFIHAKRIRRDLKRKRLFHFGKAFEVNVNISNSSTEIFEMVIIEIKNLYKEKPYKCRYIDIDTFLNIEPIVNWKGLVNLT